jgi:asparagine synthase (glutamine-hydrolysing)
MSPADAQRRIRAMCDAIVHRGPDSDGYFAADEVTMGMRRLSVIDVQGGRQPISNEDGTITVVFNGEIYNHHELRERLLRSGHTFRTRSDTEVLVHLYEELGTNMAQELRGMFAFSIWDAARQTLFIARDQTGMKPLSYMQVADGLIYCSELRSLLAFQPRELQVSSAAVMQYLAFGYVPAPNSIFSGVHKLPPGHFLLWSREKGLQTRRYWQPPLPNPAATNEIELLETLKIKLDHAVASHLESEVPLGAFLSGGLDSSTVVGLMTRHAAGRVKTFSIGFAEAEYDESEAAKRVAAAFATDHTSLIVRPDAEDIFNSVASMFDEPFGDSSAIPTFLVSQLARQSVTVALSGDGGDELFGGYTRYRNSLRQWNLPRPVSTLLATIGTWLPHALPGRNRLVDLGRSRWGRYASQVIQPVRLDEGGVVTDAQHRIGDWLQGYLSESVSKDFAADMMRLDTLTYLPGDILTKVDRTSMAVSLEARVPLLDVDLLEFAQRMPGHLRVTAEGGKRLFRKAIRDLVPDFVLTAPKKGFAVPLDQWFRGPLRHRIQMLSKSSSVLEPYVSDAAVKRLVNEHLIGRRDHSGSLWRLLVLDHWLTALNAGELARSPAVPKLRAT